MLYRRSCGEWLWQERDKNRCEGKGAGSDGADGEIGRAVEARLIRFGEEKGNGGKNI